jgi:prephenate dehydratase
VAEHPNSDKVSLAFTVENRPGTLVAALEEFASLGTNLTKLESRPVRGKPWQYVFYADYQLSTPESADEALKLLRSHCSMVKELGRYRSATREALQPGAAPANERVVGKEGTRRKETA